MEDGEMLMLQSMRDSIFYSVFLWIGISIASGTGGDEPHDSWLSPTVITGIACTVCIVGVDAVAFFIKRKSPQRREHAVFPPAPPPA